MRTKQRGLGRAAILAAALCLLAGGGFLGWKLYERYKPVTELADKRELFGISQGQVAILLDGELQEAQGIYEENQVYLPVSWVNDNLNQRFYWDSQEELLIYTLPESIVYADAGTEGSQGHLLQVQDGQAYLSLGLIQNYTDIRAEAFATSEIKRVFIDTSWEPYATARVKRQGMVRVRGGVKSLVITQADKDDQVVVLEAMDTWSKVRTEDGYIGYIENRRLEDTGETTPVSQFQAPVYTSISMDEPVVLAFHQALTQSANESLEQLLDNTQGVNVVVPTWFVITDDQGNYSSLASKEYVDLAHSRGIQVWAMLNNVSTSESAAVNTAVLMSSTDNRQKLIDQLMEDAQTYGFDGINLDFEAMRSEAGPHYIQFIRELSVACRTRGLVLSIDNVVPSAYSAFYNRKEQGIVADYVVIMGYDEHYAGGEAGSVSSLPFVEKGILDTLQEVPAQKVINGIPFYTRVWTVKDGETTSRAYGISDAMDWVQENHVELEWDDELGQYYGHISTEEGDQYIWMEEERSLSLKMDLIRENNLAGVACWKLGFEPAQIWEVVNSLNQE